MTPQREQRVPAPNAAASSAAHPPPADGRRDAARAPDSSADRPRTTPHDDEHESGYGHGV